MVKKHFKVSSALKSIIGKDLITDDFVAIFELVKNSFDAYATRVDVIFEEILSDEGKIIISDNGKGMDLEDIEKKWLFVAYSAKKEGVEDYREEIQSKRIYAGAKGIGRFSCDRLGKRLVIYSRRNPDKKFSKLTIDWEGFEKRMDDKFEKISVDYEQIKSCEYDLKKGTVLEISRIRSVWDKGKLRTLRQSLEKLINPAQSKKGQPFSIYLKANEFKSHDAEAKKNNHRHDVINGKIENFLFEKLGLKSTRIRVDINSRGDIITTELHDRGTFVYRMMEGNPYRKDNWALSDICVHLFALNKSAKSTFTRYMGVRPVQFGSVFVYKNGFRIHPFGEIRRGDVFGLDGRKQQGSSRFFGTRDLIGRIEINGENKEFRETSSRDGGLERNEAFKNLTDFFIKHVLRRLERFAIGVVKYGNVDDIDVQYLSTAFPKDKALEFIKALTKSETIHDIEFNPDIFDVVSDASEKSLNLLLRNLSRISAGLKSSELDTEISKIQRRLDGFSKATKDAEEVAREERRRREEAEEAARKEAEEARVIRLESQEQREEAEQITKQSMFLRSMVSADLENVISLHHHIGIAAGTIENYVRNVSRKIRSGKPVTAESFLEVLDQVSFVARQILATTKFATKANFNMEAELVEKDLHGYIQEYVMNVCSGLVRVDGDINSNLEFEWASRFDGDFIVRFRPLEIAIVIDALINNSVKAGAKKVTFNAKVENDHLFLIVRDDGKGVRISSRDKIFEMGFTTTNGSGLGLHHARNILNGMKGSIELVEDISQGAVFKELVEDIPQGAVFKLIFTRLGRRVR